MKQANSFVLKATFSLSNSLLQIIRSAAVESINDQAGDEKTFGVCVLAVGLGATVRTTCPYSMR